METEPLGSPFMVPVAHILTSKCGVSFLKIWIKPVLIRMSKINKAGLWHWLCHYWVESLNLTYLNCKLREWTIIWSVRFFLNHKFYRFMIIIYYGTWWWNSKWACVFLLKSLSLSHTHRHTDTSQQLLERKNFQRRGSQMEMRPISNWLTPLGMIDISAFSLAGQQDQSTATFIS